MEESYQLLVPRGLLHLLQRAPPAAVQVLAAHHLQRRRSQPRVRVAVASGPGELPLRRVAQVVLLALLYGLLHHHQPPPIPPPVSCVRASLASVK